MPLHMRLPKLRGFTNPFRVEYQIVNLDRLAELYPAGGAVTVDDLVAKGAVRKRPPVKILGGGEITVALAVTVHAYSDSAKAKIEAAGGAPPNSRTELGGDAAQLGNFSRRVGIGVRRGTSERTSPTRPDGGALGGPQLLLSEEQGPRRRLDPARCAGGTVLTAFLAAFRTPDLRKKLFFTLLIIALFRLGSQMPTPGVDTQAINQCLEPALDEGGIYGLINLFSGGALLQLSIFALGIMPYITASIIIQLLVVVIPRLETLKKEGQAGTPKLTQYTRYLTIAPGDPAVHRPDRDRPPAGRLLQGCELPLIHDDVDVFGILTMVAMMTAGTGVIMWMGELITDRGVGNGMSRPDLHPDRRDLPAGRCGRSRSSRAGASSPRSWRSGWCSSPPSSSSSRRSAASRSSTPSG